MSYLSKYQALTAQRTYARAVATRGLPALLAPYTVVRPVPTIPAQRRSVQPERISA